MNNFLEKYNSKRKIKEYPKFMLDTKSYFIIINFSKTRYFNYFLGHEKVDRFFEKFYDKIIPKYKHTFSILDKFDRLYIFFDEKIYDYNDIINYSKNIINEYKILYNGIKPLLEQEIKKEYNTISEIPLIQILNGIDYFDKKYFYISYDKYIYYLNRMNNVSYMFDIKNFNLKKIELK